MSAKLFQPIRVGRMDLRHRVVMPALTRNRTLPDHTVTDAHVEHYGLRASVPGTLLITEATFAIPSDVAGTGWRFTPAMLTSEQAAAWKKVRSYSFSLRSLHTHTRFR